MHPVSSGGQINAACEGTPIATGQADLDAIIESCHLGLQQDVLLSVADSASSKGETIATVSVSLCITREEDVLDADKGQSTSAPRSFFTSNELTDLIVMTLSIEDIHPIPSGMAKALEMVSSTDLTLSAMLSFEMGTDIEACPMIRLTGGTFKENGVDAAPKRKCVFLKSYLKAALMHAMRPDNKSACLLVQDVIEDAVCARLECWRELSLEKRKAYTDPAFDYYHGIASMNLCRLLEPGCMTLSMTEIMIEASASAFRNAHPQFCLVGTESSTKSRFVAFQILRFREAPDIVLRCKR